MFGNNIDWMAVGNIAGMVADSCRGMQTMAWGMMCLLALTAVFVLVASSDVARLIFAALFTRDAEKRHDKMDLYMAFIQDTWKQRADGIHSCIDSIVEGWKTFIGAIKALGMAAAKFTYMVMWTAAVVFLGVLAVAVLAIPVVIVGTVTLIGYATGVVVKSIRKIRTNLAERKARKEQERLDREEAEAALAELEETEETDTHQYHWIQRAVAWLLAAHRAEIVKDLAENTDITVKHVYEEEGSLFDIEESLLEKEEPTEVMVEVMVEVGECETPDEVEPNPVHEFFDAISKMLAMQAIEQWTWNQLQTEYAKLRKVVEEPLPASPKKDVVIQLLTEHHRTWRQSA